MKLQELLKERERIDKELEKYDAEIERINELKNALHIFSELQRTFGIDSNLEYFVMPLKGVRFIGRDECISHDVRYTPYIVSVILNALQSEIDKLEKE